MALTFSPLTLIRFISQREKRYWTWVVLVTFAIYSSLVLGNPLVKLFGNQNIQAIIFMLGMFLIVATIIIFGLFKERHKVEITVILGISAVYLMLFLRLGLSERSHLIEYSVLAILVQLAFTERLGNEVNGLQIGIYAFLLTFMIGTLDECLQIFIPFRVFDLLDIAFNGMAAVFAIGGSLILRWIRRYFDLANR